MVVAFGLLSAPKNRTKILAKTLLEAGLLNADEFQPALVEGLPKYPKVVNSIDGFVKAS